MRRLQYRNRRSGPLVAVAFGLFVAGLLGLGLIGPAMAQPTEPVETSVDGLLVGQRSSEGPVRVAGELIGDYGFRGDGWVWSQLNGDSYATKPVLEGGRLTGSNTGIGIRIPEELVVDLEPPGGYRRRGPLVEVVGTWVFHDPDRGGESYLSAESIVVIEPGRIVGEGPDLVPLALGGALLVLSVGLWSSRPRPE